MTEPHHEPSYYEIALTNRQVVVAFVVLLICLLSAFFSGVWIGRGGTERSPAEQLARAAPPPEPTEGRNLEELKFFTDESSAKRQGKSGPGKSGQGATAAAAATEPATEAAPAPAPPRPAPAPPPPPASARPVPVPAAPARAAAAPPPHPQADDGAVVRSRPLPEETTGRDIEAGAATARPAGGAGKTAAPGAGAVVIQVFASAEQVEAKKVRDRLARGGEPAFVSPLTVDGRTMYRVRVGPFTSRPRAQKEAERVRKSYKLDTWLTE